MLNTDNVAFSPIGDILLVNARGAESFGFGDTYTATELIDTRTGEPISDLTTILGEPLDDLLLGGNAEAKFTTDGSRVVAVSYGGVVTVWRTSE